MIDSAEAILEVSRRLYDRNMLAAGDGNLSYRNSEGNIVITPSGLCKAFMKPEDMALVTLEGESLSGKASSEKWMHLKVYQSLPRAKAVIHAHPPFAIAWSVAFPESKELPVDSLSELILSVGSVPIVPYQRPGTKKMGEVLEPYLERSRSMILARHGALSWGESLEEAWRGMERIEHSAEILYRAQLLGGLTSLPSDELKELRKLRKQLGERVL